MTRPPLVALMTGDNHTVIARTAATVGPPYEVREQHGLRWLTRGGDLMQSVIDLDAPQRLVMPNQQAMLAALALTGPPASVLNLGFGGGAFERWFAHYLPATPVTSVDIDTTTVALAQRHFAVDPAHHVVISDAAGFVHQHHASHTLVLCDLFDGEAHPACLHDTAFYRDLRRLLGNDGVLAMNLSPADNNELLALLVVMRKSFGSARLLPIKGHGNVVVLLSNSATQDQARALPPTLTSALEPSVQLNAFTLLPPPGTPHKETPS